MREMAATQSKSGLQAACSTGLTNTTQQYLSLSLTHTLSFSDVLFFRIEQPVYVVLLMVAPWLTKGVLKTVVVCFCQAAGVGVIRRLWGRGPPSPWHLHSSKQIPPLVHTGTPGVPAVRAGLHHAHRC